MTWPIEPFGKAQKAGFIFFGQLGNAGMRYGIHGFKPTLTPLLPLLQPHLTFFFGGKYLTPYPLLRYLHRHLCNAPILSLAASTLQP